MARCLIVGCGCRGRALAARLREGGHAVRGTTRDPGRVGVIESTGAEAYVGDPDRVATLAPALEHVTIACLLLGSARGDEQALRQLHGSRLEMLLRRMLDTTIRGVVYEAAGSVPSDALGTGAELVGSTCQRSRIPYALLECDPADGQGWVDAAAHAIDHVLK